VRQEEEAHAEVGLLKDAVPEFLDLGEEELVGDLGRNACAVAKLRAQQEAAAPPSRPTPRPKKPFTATTTMTPTRAEAHPAAAPKPRPRKKLPRIIAVATEKNEATSAGAAKAVMLFDTESQQIIGNRVYDIEREPRTGDEVRFETYSTSYVGAAL
jgi:hypothetical protein